MGFKTTIGGHTFREENGIWWDPNGNEMSNESIYRIFGNKKVKPDPKTGKLKFDWDYNNSRTSKQKEQERDHQFNFPEGGAYDALGNNRVRDYNKRPLTGSEKTENEMRNMMGGMKSGMGGKKNLFNEMDSNDDFFGGMGGKKNLFNEMDSNFGGKGFWQPPKDNPYIPSYNEVQKSGQMYRGPDFARENYASPFGQGASWNSPIKSMSPSIGDSFRNMEQYRMPSSNSLTPLSPSGIDNFNQQNWSQPAPAWNSGMKNWR